MLISKYILFAVISTVVNLLSQYLFYCFYSQQYALILGMIIGTAAGLVTKYVLDRDHIFQQEQQTGAQEMKQFGLYSFFGLFTTCLFWLTEYAFDVMFDSGNAKYLGAVIGLAIGYTIKFFLDKKYVFKDSNVSLWSN